MLADEYEARRKAHGRLQASEAASHAGVEVTPRGDHEQDSHEADDEPEHGVTAESFRGNDSGREPEGQQWGLPPTS